MSDIKEKKNRPIGLKYKIKQKPVIKKNHWKTDRKLIGFIKTRGVVIINF